MASYPIEDVLGEIRNALNHNSSVVVQAPPGAGKTTILPLALLNEPWLVSKTILILEPRRLAARTAAARMAELLDEPVGQTVGYHIRLDRKVSARTRIEVVTEGMLTRRIQQDPALEGTGLIVFDEFHERSLNSDLGLALCLEIVQAFRPDLKLMVMSATLDTTAVAVLLKDAPVICSQGKAWPVETRYLPLGMPRLNRGTDMVEACYWCVIRVLNEEQGDILVFLPGAGEIRRLTELLGQAAIPAACRVIPLYGNLTKDEQDLAIRPSVRGCRKIVLATPIAETSITIQGVRIVIDSGLVRVPRFYAGSGLTRLETVPASVSSTDQRRGRAGRTGPGICYRMWAEAEQAMRQPFSLPEILQADLAPLALELAVWGVADPHGLKWINPPPPGAFAQARDLLIRLDALDSEGRVTAHGKALSGLGMHPRLGHMLLLARSTGSKKLACRIAALLEERDFLIAGPGSGDADIRLRLEILTQGSAGTGLLPSGFRINHGILARVRMVAEKLDYTLGGISSGRSGSGKNTGSQNQDGDLQEMKDGHPDQAGRLLALAFPDRIAMARPGRSGRFLLASGSGAFLPRTDLLASESFLVAADLDGQPDNARIYLAAPYAPDEFFVDFSDRIQRHEQVGWDSDARCLVARMDYVYDHLVVKTLPLTDVSVEAQVGAMIGAIRDQGLSLLPWTPALREFQARAVLLKSILAEPFLPDLSDVALAVSLDQWLGPFLAGITSAARMKKLDLDAAIKGQLTWQQKHYMDQEAPTHLTVPSGSRIRLTYLSDQGAVLDAPVLAVRIQELFGLTRTPCIAKGTRPVTLHLLSPAGRPVQVTRDLCSFWATTYAEVKKDLRGRYPKHHWPDDPLTARPTSRVKPRVHS